jgi:hypothetical protein
MEDVLFDGVRPLVCCSGEIQAGQQAVPCCDTDVWHVQLSHLSTCLMMILGPYYNNGGFFGAGHGKTEYGSRLIMCWPHVASN